MKSEYYLQRHWAETVRLYTGLLDEPDRNEFLKNLADKDVLLACECRATFFTDDPFLDEYLTRIAVVEAVKFEKAKSSANGLLALAELNQFDEISKIFQSIPVGSDSYSHNQVVANYIKNGNELQIISFLNVLSQTNVELLGKALDMVLDQKIFFSNYSLQKAIEIAGRLKTDKNLLFAKVVCLFQLKSQIDDPNVIFHEFLKHKQLKFAERLISLTSVQVSESIVEYLPNYIKNNGHKQLISQLLNIFAKLKINLDDEYISICLSKSLNPLIKSLSLTFGNASYLSEDLAVKICLVNIDIGIAIVKRTNG
ncbi:hypothetical protein [Dyadobacter sp. NIV53]|uniref:hypothetical protein n=1 Tax=Dyadobacter sp. NIV53 TaxID=2861765 RepID=UPI001C88841F|nr:hypothetical protein [Dyadobacter sp. NIV53]